MPEEAAVHGLIFCSSQPMDVYDAVDVEVERRTKDDEASAQLWQRECLLHLARAVDDGFEVTEVWTTEQAAQTWFDNVLGASLDASGFDMQAATMTTFEPHRIETHQRESENA